MECQAIQSWTFSGLVGAFLDLAITYLLLCGSTLAFIASKFLGLFGLCLPCPCNEKGNPNSDNCFQRFLVDCPTEKLSSVQLSVNSKFPFDPIWANDLEGCQLNLKLLKERNCKNGHLKLDGEMSCSSVSDARRLQDLEDRELVPGNESVGFGAMDLTSLKEGRFDLKGKGIMNQKPRSGLRRRRKGSFDCGKHSSVASYDLLWPDARGVSWSPSSNSIKNAEESLVPVNANGGDGSAYGGEAPMDIGLQERVSHGFELGEPVDDNKSTEKDASPAQEFKFKQPGFDVNEENEIRVLEQALEEEHAACTSLYYELEKERSAAATAADEAMAMILRLQEEKASIEMEARQYQRMIEEKSEYDAEEMNILKEILLRREREKHFLEKEVEAYRQMIFGNEQLDGDMHDMVGTLGLGASSSLFSSEDPVLMLQWISESIGKKEEIKNANKSSDYEITSVESQNLTLAFGKELPIPVWDEDADFPKQGDIHRHPRIDKHHPHRSGDDFNEEFQEKGMVSMDSQVNESSPQGLTLLEKTITLVGEEQKLSDNSNLYQGKAPKTSESHNENEINIPYDGEDLKKHMKDADQRSGNQHSSMHDSEPHVHDVHVIDDESNLRNESSENKSERVSSDATLNVPRKVGLSFEASGVQKINILDDCPSTSRLVIEPDIKRSNSDMPSGLPPMGASRGKALPSDLRRNSMSAVDYERSKIDTEVEWLRERLRIVQEGREKLNFSVEHREREKIQLQLLEDIASQLREIRHLTAPGKAVQQASLPLPSRQASLPLPSSKVMSKKRRWRSASLGVRHSS
ncbi:hypothetical protein L1049_016614 [Liquidambar formosana]|uniref:GTD-binding domain-containing protein n=1 Tax=Liquidambar formosana TaxID=63359 RepID=A0AAP0RZQ5_LIQFO